MVLSVSAWRLFRIAQYGAGLEETQFSSINAQLPARTMWLPGACLSRYATLRIASSHNITLTWTPSFLFFFSLFLFGSRTHSHFLTLITSCEARPRKLRLNKKPSKTPTVEPLTIVRNSCNWKLFCVPIPRMKDD